jgi:hypothetical protein
MATPRRSYVSLPLGIFEETVAAGVSEAAAALLLRIWTHREKRSVPGLLRLGRAALAESFHHRSPKRVSQQLEELVRARRLLVDPDEILLFCVGAVTIDGPRTENSVRGMASQIRELPKSSPVVLAVIDEIEQSLKASSSSWLGLWRELVYPEPVPEPRPESGTESGPLLPPSSGTVLRVSAAASAAGYRRAWGRLPRPFAAAADADVMEAIQKIDEDSFNQLIRELSYSKWLNPRSDLKIPPTLNRLLKSYDYRRRVLAGEFCDAAQGVFEQRWRCPDCLAYDAHQPTDECCAPCRGCGLVHSPEDYCRKLREIQIAEAERSDTMRDNMRTAEHAIDIVESSSTEAR